MVAFAYLLLAVSQMLLSIMLTGFSQVDAVADSHRFKCSEHKPVDGRAFINAVSKEVRAVTLRLYDSIDVIVLTIYIISRLSLL